MNINAFRHKKLAYKHFGLTMDEVKFASLNRKATKILDFYIIKCIIYAIILSLCLININTTVLVLN